MATAAGITIKHADICNATRTTNQRLNAPPKILVKFIDPKQKNLFLRKNSDIDFHKLRHLTNETIYIEKVVSPYQKYTDTMEIHTVSKRKKV